MADEQPWAEEAAEEQVVGEPQAPEQSQAGVVPSEEDGTAEAGAAAVEQDLAELTAKAQKADEYLALAQRTQADFENFRKRAARDQRAADARGVARLARELLPALDNLGRALAAAEADGAETGEEHLSAGVKLVHGELVAALARVGIEPFSPQGERFDPQEHEAITQIEVEGAESGTVAEVYQQGYRHGETVLRPARVVVAA